MILMTYVIYRDKKSLNTEYVKTFEVELKVCKSKKNKLKKKVKNSFIMYYLFFKHWIGHKIYNLMIKFWI